MTDKERMTLQQNAGSDKAGLNDYVFPTRRLSFQEFFKGYLKMFEGTIQDYLAYPYKLVFLFKTTVNGKERQIVTYQNTPEGQMLRHLHRLFALVLKGVYKPHPESYAYQKGKDIKACLRKHIKSDTFLKTDIHSYFDSVSYDLLLSRILELRLWPESHKDVLEKVLATCFYDGHLPIGFVSSPVLSDIFLKDVDDRMSGVNGICYTRYADDIIVSSSGPDALTKLEQILETLHTELTNHNLELNNQKTYMRQLKSEGDSIHLLGLNMVKTQTERNRITVSQRFITETSKEIGFLLQHKTKLDVWEMQRRFISAMGKVSFIRFASSECAGKLKKLLAIKTGYKGPVGYNALSKVLFEDPAVLHEYEMKKQLEAFSRIRKINIYPNMGRCWECVTIPAGSQEDRITIRYYLFSICREFERNTNRLSINRMDLSIGDELFSFEYPYDTEKFRSFIKRIRTEASEVRYSADYRFDNGQPEKLIKCGKYHFTARDPFRPLNAVTTAGTGILYSERENRWVFSREVRTSGKKELFEAAEFTEILDQSEWEGKINVDLKWPLKADEELSMAIEGTVSQLKKLLNPWVQDEFSQGESRSFRIEEISIRTEAQMLMVILVALKELSSLVKQAKGVNKIDAWFVPFGFLGTTKETRLKYLSATNKKGRFELRKFEE